MAHDVESVERVIPATATAIFALLADPRRHRDIDGSGTVRASAGDPCRLALGSRFAMSMRKVLPYSMVSEVVEYEGDRRIAWQTRPPGPFLARIVGGRIWRYELEPVAGGTRVRESWDISQERIKVLVRVLRKQTIESMTRTLARIEELVTESAA